MIKKAVARWVKEFYNLSRSAQKRLLMSDFGQRYNTDRLVRGLNKGSFNIAKRLGFKIGRLPGTRAITNPYSKTIGIGELLKGYDLRDDGRRLYDALALRHELAEASEMVRDKAIGESLDSIFRNIKGRRGYVPTKDRKIGSHYNWAVVGREYKLLSKTPDITGAVSTLFDFRRFTGEYDMVKKILGKNDFVLSKITNKDIKKLRKYIHPVVKSTKDKINKDLLNSFKYEILRKGYDAFKSFKPTKNFVEYEKLFK